MAAAPVSEDTLLPPMAMTLSHVLPDTLVPQVAEYQPPVTLPEAVTVTPLSMSLRTVDEVHGVVRSLTPQFEIQLEFAADAVPTTVGRIVTANAIARTKGSHDRRARCI